MDSDTFLKIWAVVGPLLAAAASAVWARRVQLNDRTHSDSRDDLRYERERQSLEGRLKLERNQRQTDELKKAMTDFMAGSQQYILMRSQEMTQADEATSRAVSDALKRYTDAGQLIILLGDHALETATIELWNKIMGIPKPYNAPDPADYQERLGTYRTARATFNREAKRWLTALDA